MKANKKCNKHGKPKGIHFKYVQMQSESNFLSVRFGIMLRGKSEKFQKHHIPTLHFDHK